MPYKNEYVHDKTNDITIEVFFNLHCFGGNVVYYDEESDQESLPDYEEYEDGSYEFPFHTLEKATGYIYEKTQCPNRFKSYHILNKQRPEMYIAIDHYKK